MLIAARSGWLLETFHWKGKVNITILEPNILWKTSYKLLFLKQVLCVRKWVRMKRLLVCWSLHYSLENINIVHARMTLLPRYQLVVFVIIRQKLCLRPNRKVLLPFFRRTLRDSNYLCSTTLQLPSSIHCYDRTRHTIRYFESAFVIFNSVQALFLAFFPITCSKRSFFFLQRVPTPSGLRKFPSLLIEPVPGRWRLAVFLFPDRPQQCLLSCNKFSPGLGKSVVHLIIVAIKWN